MALRKFLKMKIKNQSGVILICENAVFEDGGYNDNSSFPIKMENNNMYEVNMKTKTGGNGPKGYADYYDKNDLKKKFRICFELSRNDSNPRYVYILPMGDYVFDGSYKMYEIGRAHV